VVVNFADFTSAQQVESLVDTARGALSRYGVEPSVLENINHEYNSTFAVTPREGSRCALRINVNSGRTEAHLAAEIFFINLLQYTGGFSLACPIENLAGSFITPVPHDATGRELLCVLFTWLDGEDIGDDLTVDQAHRVGHLMARMHIATEGRSLPKGAYLPLLDDFMWQEEDLLLGPNSGLTAEDYAVIQKCRDAIQAVIRELYDRHPPQLIHADLHGWNLKLHGDTLSVFDFDDSGMGLPVQDLAVALYYLDTSEQREALEAGYSSVRPLPDFSEYQMQSLLLQRRIHLLNYLYGTVNSEHRELLPDYRNETIRRVKVFLGE
jgi:Ser/Thr protein kinase RdoA (MazF antagonist)